ncbi:LysR family transcriptional regulator [Sinorhizobium numidicum]|uniref:LysR family transcriptional regulator n=1 Tax=Sinorhizobium numidicum TaxID=680248 RepID=A0ABY8CRK3_9HYPH|nr:LysR family transcriptional regulator [Sinorhizobium numidicum]WEX75275.1 LysR family transcriptional regulator [Sinorhizobium numidicum]WEX81270.1 LysR family transcriptional regulator [Sinorhizobium numidicum]
MDIVSALRTFLRVAETGSFSAAAADLNLTQPAVSRQVSALEAHLNTRLLHRTTTALALTAEGERIIPMALRVVEAVDALGETTCAEGAMASGKVRLTLPAPLGLYMSDRLTGLLERHPGLHVELIFREEPSDVVGEGIDLEVRLGPVADSSLICRRIGWTTAFLVAAPSYLEGRIAPETPNDLSGHECICYRRAGNGRSWSFSNGADEVAVRIAPRLIADNAVAVHRAALAGSGLAVLSHILACPDIEAGRLVNVMPDFPPTRLPISVVYASRRNMPLRVRTVLDFLADAVSEDPLMVSTSVP